MRPRLLVRALQLVQTIIQQALTSLVLQNRRGSAQLSSMLSASACACCFADEPVMMMMTMTITAISTEGLAVNERSSRRGLLDGG